MESHIIHPCSLLSPTYKNFFPRTSSYDDEYDDEDEARMEIAHNQKIPHPPGLLGSKRFDDKDEDELEYGWYWYDEEQGDEFRHHDDVRELWLTLSKAASIHPSSNTPTLTESISNVKGGPPSPYSTKTSAVELSSSHEVIILAQWINPNPECSVKMTSGGNFQFASHSMSTSCCVSGFRIIQLDSGELTTEFLTIFCYGSRSYHSWKKFNEFKKLAGVIDYIHYQTVFDVGSLQFYATLDEWNRLMNNYKYHTCFPCFQVSYLIKVSIHLGRFMRSLFAECPTPGLILCFLQTKDFSPPDCHSFLESLLYYRERRLSCLIIAI
jgi:hypothetical protein